VTGVAGPDENSDCLEQGRLAAVVGADDQVQPFAERDLVVRESAVSGYRQAVNSH
jgi:hypothetical protein